MPDPEVDCAARFLATHAVPLLGLGILAATASIGAIVWSTRLAGRFRPVAQQSIATLASRVQQIGIVWRAISRVHDLVPSAYLALHLALGLLG